MVTFNKKFNLLPKILKHKFCEKATKRMSKIKFYISNSVQRNVNLETKAKMSKLWSSHRNDKR